MQKPLAAMIGIAIVGVLIALDQTIVGTALPTMVAELQGFDLYPWVATAYLLANVVLIPVTGRLGDLYGRKPFLLASIALFVLASAYCGIADSMPQLVLARALQGVGGGMLLGSTFAAVSDIFPDTLERVRWHALLSAAFGSASALGPVLGGWMTGQFGWRSVFFINLPIGLVALWMVGRYLPWVEHVDKAAEKRIDWLGVVLLALAIGSLLLALELAERIGFISLTFGSGALLFLSLGAAFVVHQRRSSAPVIPPDLFAIPVVRQLSLLATLAGCGLFVLVFYSPLLLQAGFSYSPAEAGLLVMPLMVCVTVGSIINGRLIPRVKRPEGLFAKGVLALVLALLGLCVASSATPHWLLWGVFALCGLAFGFQLPNLTIQMQASVEPRHVGIASALIQTLRTLGGLLGASVAGLVVSLVFAHGSARLLAEQQIDRQEVRHLFESPQVLLRAGEQDGVAELGIRFGFDAPALLNAARFELIDGIRAAFLLCLILAIVSYGVGRTLPPYVGKRQP